MWRRRHARDRLAHPARELAAERRPGVLLWTLLVAGLLAKPKRMNLAAAAGTAVAVLAGLVLIEGEPATLIVYLQRMFGPFATNW